MAARWYLMMLIFGVARGFAQGPPQLVSPTNRAVDVPWHVTLDWKSVSGASGYDYRVYQGGIVVIQNQGGPIVATQVTLDLDPSTVYEWQARARVLPQNNPWSSLWRFTTVAVYPPAQVSPTNGSTGVSWHVILDWDPVLGATGYDYKVLNNGVTIAQNTGGPIAGTAVSLELDPGTTYQWQVRARVLPQNNPWSSLWTFTTAPVVPPAQVGPANGATGVWWHVTLDWNAVNDATGYDYKVSNNGVVVAENTGGPIVGTAISLDLDPSTTYQWQVRARVLPQNNPWSSLWSFTTDSVRPPTQVSPEDGAQSLYWHVTLDWHTVRGASGYDYRVYKDGVIVAQNQGGPIAPGHVSLDLQPDSCYEWQARARVLVQDNPWSPLWSFATLPPFPGLQMKLENIEVGDVWGIGNGITIAAEFVLVPEDGTGPDDLEQFISSVTFTANGNVMDVATAIPFEALWTPSSQGDFMIDAQALLKNGQSIHCSNPCSVRALPPDRVPTFILQPSPTIGLVGKPATLSLSANCAAQISYQWEKAGEAADGSVLWQDIAGANGNQLMISSLSSTDEATYRCSLLTTDCAVRSAEVEMIVLDSLPVAITGVENDSVLQTGDSMQFSVAPEDPIFDAEDLFGLANTIKYFDGAVLLAELAGTNLDRNITITNLTAGNHALSVLALNATDIVGSSDAVSVNGVSAASWLPNIGLLSVQDFVVALSMRGVIGANYAIEQSSNLRSWSAVQTNACISKDQTVMLLRQGNPQSGFFRLRLLNN